MKKAILRGSKVGQQRGVGKTRFRLCIFDPVLEAEFHVDKPKKDPPPMADLEKESKAKKPAAKTESYTLPCPKVLSYAASLEWKKLMKVYDSMGGTILTSLDRPALIQYCEAVAIYNRAHGRYRQLLKVKNPDNKIENEIDKSIERMNKQTRITSTLAKQLYLTPQHRLQMGDPEMDIEPAAEDNEIDAFFKAKKKDIPS